MKMNWGIYKKRKKLILWALVINVNIVAVIAVLPAFGKTRCDRSPFTRDRSNLKQIGTTVAMYFTDGESALFPKNPKDLDLDPSIVNNAVQNSWKELSQTSPYYFFPEEGSVYTGSALFPLAVRKAPIKGYDLCHMVFEDGHVKAITPQEVRMYIKMSSCRKDIKLIIERAFKELHYTITNPESLIYAVFY